MANLAGTIADHSYCEGAGHLERQPGENPCADKNEEQIELLDLTEGSVPVASNVTEPLSRELTVRKLLDGDG